MKKTLLWIIRVCCVAILLLPLYVDGSTIFPYTFSKAIVFQFLVELSLGAYIILQFFDRSYRVDWKNRLIQAQSVWIGVLVVLSFISVDVVRSWWSTGQWMTGTITYLHFFAWFIILASVFRSWNEWRVLMRASVVTSCVVALYGLGQLIGFGAAHYDPSLGRIYSTLGNPIYLAQYLLLNLFLAAFLFLKERSQFAKILLGFFACVLAGTLFFTGTRSAVLTLLISLVLFFGLLLFNTASKKYRIASLAGCVALIACIVGSFFWLQTGSGTTWAKAHVSPGLQRIIYQTFQDPARVELSRIAFQGFAAKPLYGWGPNNYSYVFSTNVRPQDYGVLFPSRWYDAAHNQVMNVLATTGLVGLLAFLLPWCVAWWLLWKRFMSTRATHERIGYSIIGLFFFAYFLQNLTVFDTPGPLIVLYFVFAFVVFLTNTQTEKKMADRSASVPLALVVPVVGILTVVMVTTLSVVPYEKARIGRRAIDTIAHDFDRGLLYFQRALSASTFVRDDIRSELARAAFFYDEKYSFPKEKKKEFIGYALEQLEASAKNHPYSLEYDTLLLALYRSYAKFSPTALRSAEELAMKLVERYPRRRDILFEYVFIELDLGKKDIAKEYARKIIDLDPTRGDAHWWMAQVLATAGDPSDSLDEIENARKLGYPIFKDASVFIRLALRPSSDNYKRLYSLIDEAWFGKQLRTLDMAEAVVIGQTKLGEHKSAMKILSWIRERNPEYAKRVEEDLKRLEK